MLPQCLTAKSVFSDRSLKVGCFLHRSWYTCMQPSTVPVSSIYSSEVCLILHAKGLCSIYVPGLGGAFLVLEVCMMERKSKMPLPSCSGQPGASSTQVACALAPRSVLAATEAPVTVPGHAHNRHVKAWSDSATGMQENLDASLMWLCGLHS